MKERTKILVIGGAGFIGSHLCEILAEDSENEVFSLDNYSIGSTQNHVEGVTYIQGEASEIQNLITFSPDYIYHLGEYSRVEQSFEDIAKVWKNNKLSIFPVLEFTRNTGAKIIYAGSSTKFGDGGLGRNQSPYAWIKASNTELVENYGNWFNISYAIVYFYNVYGGREISKGKYATLIGLFKEQFLAGKKLTIVSPGNQLRNFTHIDDIIKGLILVGERGSGNDFGIGSKTQHSVLDIAHLFGGEIEMLPERPGNRTYSEIDTSKTELLGWKAEKDIVNYINQIKQKA